jgi:hypothetical protein
MATTNERARPGLRADDPANEDALQRIRSALHGLRYGAVTALVQDGVVVLVERTEKVRLSRRERGA